MTDTHLYKNIEELLPRFCEGTTTEAESRLVEEWIAEDEAHLKMVNQLHALYLATDTLHMAKRVNTEKALKKVKKRMKPRTIAWWVWPQRIAAMLSIPLLMAVLWMYQTANGRMELAQMMEIKTNPGMTTSVVLPDSTVVYLNSESTLRYPCRFTRKSREVELTGEGYFEVAKDKKRRFVVSTVHQSQVEVYGTSFNVEAYAHDNRISTTLVEGSVAFHLKDKAGEAKTVTLKPNQKLVYIPESGETKMYATTCESETAWKDGNIIFHNTSMEDVLRMLGKRYNVDFVVKNKHLKEYSFTGTFSSQRLERILEYFKISSKIHWRYLDSDDITDKKQQIEIY